MGYNTLLTVGAALLLGALTVSTRTLVWFHDTDSMENEYVLAACGAAQSLIDEAKTRAFDEKCIAQPAADTSGFTLPGALGRDGSDELVPTADTMVTSAPYSSANPGYPGAAKFDDLDDYHGYVRVLRASRALEGDTIRSTVVYANPDGPDQDSPTARTMCKRMTVTVTGKYLTRPVVLTYGFTY